MSHDLSNKTKEIISKTVGIPYEKLIQMDDEEIDAFIEKKTGKKITWPIGAKIDGLKTKTVDKMTNSKYDELSKKADERIRRNNTMNSADIQDIKLTKYSREDDER